MGCVCFGAEGEAIWGLYPPKFWLWVPPEPSRPSLSRAPAWAARTLLVEMELVHTDGRCVGAGKAVAQFWEGSLAPGVATQISVFFFLFEFFVFQNKG